MTTHRVSASALVRAPAERVYAILADYRDGHPHILPKQYFRALEVERGGVGAGTRIRFEMRVLGRTRRTQAEITEPEPGRVLLESYPAERMATSFTVEPRDGGADAGAHALVTIATELPVRGGLLGMLERAMATALLRRIYAQELALIDEFAGKAARGRGTGDEGRGSGGEGR